MQTILGGGGAIGTELAKALTAYTTDIRIVGRNPKKVNDTDTLFAADLTNFPEVREAVKGSEVVYLTAGLTYNAKLWQEQWPVIMQNLIQACIEHSSKLVFFDNIYMYDGRYLNPIKEDNPINPPSKKGKVRADIAQLLMHAVEQNELVALIARCADFYGPSVKNTSILTEAVVKPLHEGKTANWFVNDQMKHSFTYTVDAAKATALLGNTPDAYGEVWHLPTAKNPLTGKEWVDIFAKELKLKPKHRVVSKFVVKIMGWFIPIMGESHEMLYQYDKHYVFNSDKFDKRFNFKTTTYEEGVKAIVEADYK